MARFVVGVMGPGEATETETAMATELGGAIARNGWVLLTGGRRAGITDAASRGAHEAGGLVVGVLPDDGSQRDAVSPHVDVAVFTDLGNARNNVNVLSSDVVIACGMGPGTASEVALALKAGKSVVLLGASEAVRAFFREIGANRVLLADSVERAIELVRLSDTRTADSHRDR